MIKKLPKEKKVSKRKKTTNKTFKNYIAVAVLSALVLLLTFIGIYLAVNNNTLQDQTQSLKEEITKLRQMQKDFIKDQEDQVAKYFEEKTKDLEIEYAKPIDNQEYIDRIDKQNTKIEFVYDDEPVEKTQIKEPQTINVITKDKQTVLKKEDDKKTVKKDTITKQLPKLAIIIDDVTNSRQIKAIKDIGYNVNMSFLPPTPRHKYSAKVAQDLENYMIHLPLEATSFKYNEEHTLITSDSIAKIERRIKLLSELYPKAKFINNHTGSKFTANKEAMDKLFYVLKKYDYTFIDSKTTAKSVAKESAKKYGLRVLTRNVFLDNKKDKQYIQKQLKKAISIAKRYGSAIAIGHPYKVTFEALKDSKIDLEGIETVFVDKL